MKRFILLLLCVSVVCGCSRVGREGRYSRTAMLMGTFVQVKVAEPGYRRGEIAGAVEEALQRARELEKKFSVFDPKSEANALNLAGTRKVSPELFDLVEEAARISRVTGGEFDVTVAPALKANGFYEMMPAELRDRIPDGFSGVGWKNIQLDPGGGSIALGGGAWIDLSGIAKGYIVDQMSAVLRKKRITGFLINAGGDIYCGTKNKGDAWKIGVREPGTRNVVSTLGVKNAAVATSGDYENVIIEENTGEIISHIIDSSPDKTGRKVPSSVTVIAPACAEADALATGMMAMGREKAMALADTMENVSIIVIECPGGQRTINFSRGAAKYLRRK